MNDKTKIHTLRIKGCESINRLEKDGKLVRMGSIFIGGWITFMSDPKYRIKQIVFSPTGFNTDKYIAFDWSDVKKIIITDAKKAKKSIGFWCEKENEFSLFTIQYKEYLIDIIKTYCSVTIEDGDIEH